MSPIFGAGLLANADLKAVFAGTRCVFEDLTAAPSINRKLIGPRSGHECSTNSNYSSLMLNSGCSRDLSVSYGSPLFFLKRLPLQSLGCAPLHIYLLIGRRSSMGEERVLRAYVQIGCDPS